jgi:hypothetical protein
VRVLLALPDRDFDVTEVAVPWWILREAGHDIVFATERAGFPPQARPPAAAGVALNAGENLRTRRVLAAFRRPARGPYRWRQGIAGRSEGMMAVDSQAEIAASVAALRDLGPGYDQALAEGLVERIGADIDKRIAAAIDNRVTAEVDSRLLVQLDRYAGCRHQRRRATRMIRAERRAARADQADRSGRQSIVLALGTMLVALPVTAIVLRGSPGFAAIMLMALIWVIVGVINVAYAMRKHPPLPPPN